MSDRSGAAVRAPVPSFAEFVTLIALMMGLGSLSIDNLLPAFGLIQAEFGITNANEIQLLITAYMVGFAVCQIIYGPISDFAGRRPVLLIGLIVYAAGSLMALVSDSFAMLLTARAVQGMGCASLRVLTVSIVRDRFEGREMARVMSLTMMVFIVVPVFAPAIGSLFLLFGNWHMIFVSMLAMAAVIAVWFGLRMPETLHPEYRFPPSLGRIGSALRLTVTTRATIGYATAMGLMMGALMGYVGSSQQILESDVYGLGSLFPVAFGLIAAIMSVASFVNARLVRRLGMRRLSHGATCAFVAISAVHVGIAMLFDGRPPLLLFGLLLAVAQFLFAVAMPNFNAMSMEPLGAVAGTASSFIGFYTTLMGAVLGMAIGQAFDGTVLPLLGGYLATGVLCLAVVAWTEHGRLFQQHHPDPQ